MRLRSSFGAPPALVWACFDAPSCDACCRPQQLQFTAADEMLAVENMDVLKLNGFELERAEEREASEGEAGSESMRAPLQLVAQPMSKDTIFDVKGKSSSFRINTN